MAIATNVDQLANDFIAAVRDEVHDPVLLSRRDELEELIHLIQQGNHNSLLDFVPTLQYFAGGRSRAQLIAEELESLPIDTEDIGNYAWLGFVLVCGKWVPCYHLEINPVNGWAMCDVRDPDGDTSVIAARPGQWADCSADDTPCMPWAWDDAHDLPSGWRS